MTSAVDDGLTGSFRFAILEVNRLCSPGGGDVISMSGPLVINAVAAPFPAITCAGVTIAGNGATLDGSALTPNGTCFLTSSPATGNTAINDLRVRNFGPTTQGIGLCGALDTFQVSVNNTDIGINPTSGSKVRSSEAYSNTFRGILANSGVLIQSSALYGNAVGAYISLGSVVENSNVYGNTNYGIISSGGTVRNNNVYLNNNGIYGDFGSDIVNNRAYQNTLRGIVAGGSNVRGNTVYSNGSDGIQASNNSYVGGISPTIDRNYVYGNAGKGIIIASGGLARNNWVGVKPDGVTAVANNHGIDVNNGASAEDNLVSGNTNHGIEVSSSGSAIGNLIGMNASFTAALPNGVGVFASSGLVSGNRISGNSGAGILTYYNGNVIVEDNFVGLGAGGNGAMPNNVGIQVFCSGNMRISRNFVSGNTSHGMFFEAMSNSLVQDNKVGVGADGVTPVPNGGDGITIDFGNCDGLMPGNSNDLLGNTIAHNSGDGVSVFAGTGHRISAGRIFSNNLKNINLGFDGAPLANDALDVDVGPNDRQNYPVINSVAQVAGATTISYSLSSKPGASYTVEFFAISSGTPGGELYLGADNPPPTDAGGLIANTVTAPGLHDFISAIAIDASGNTSEFSLAVAALKAPAASITPASVNFGDIPVTKGSTQQLITLTSTGDQPYVISSIGPSGACTLPLATNICGTGDFMCTTDCNTGTPYAKNTSCRITTSFVPNTLGAKSLTLSICDNSAASPRTVTLSGNGVAFPALIVNPAAVDFGSVNVGMSGASRIVTFGNPGNFAQDVGAVQVIGPYTLVSTTCTTPFAGNDMCTAVVQFVPTAAGPAPGEVRLQASTATAPVIATLSGIGIQEPAFALPASIDFGTYTLGNPTLAQSISIKNTGNGPLLLGTLAITPPFTVANGCAAPLAPSASCTLLLGFDSAAPGSFAGMLTIPSNAPGGPRTVSLKANAVLAPVAASSISPASIDFGSIGAGSSSPPTVITVTSTGDLDYLITGMSSSASCAAGPICSGAFACTTDCAPSTPYSRGSSCRISATFAPGAPGAQSAKLFICDNTSASPRSIALSGVATAPPAVTVIVLPGSLNFGGTLVGSSSAPQLFKFANPGDTASPIGPVTLTGAFVLAANSCGSVIEPRGFCLVEVAFAPTSAGAQSGSVSVTFNGGTALAALRGSGIQEALLALPARVDLGSITLGTTSPLTSSIELRNTGNATLTFSSVVVSGPFALSNGCPLNLGSGAACNLTVTFLATTVGEFTGSISVVTNARGGSGSIALTARAQAAAVPLVKVAPTFMGFGDRVVGTVSSTQRVTIVNEGGAPAQLGPLNASIEFLVSTTCGTQLAPGASCLADVAFRPIGFGPRSGQVLVNSNSAGSPHRIDLVGTGCRPFVRSGNRLGSRSNCSP